MKEIKLSSKYPEWRWFQYHMAKVFKEVRYMTVVVSRQHGKSVFGVDLLVDFAMRFKNRENPEAVVVMKTANQAFATYFKRTHQILKDLEGITYFVSKSPTGVTTVTFKRPWLNDVATITFAGIGNIDALRGRTNDLVIIDEASWMPKKVWYDVLKETLDDTQGKAFITSTQYGQTWFYQLQKTFEQMYENGEKWVRNLEWDNVTAQLRTDEEIRRKELLAKSTGEWASYLREQKNDPHAVDLDEAPFSMAVVEKRSHIQSEVENLKYFGSINVAVDIGKPNNNAAWVFAQKSSGKVIFIDYVDQYNQYQLIDYLWKKYKGMNIKIFYPEDANQPTMMEGISIYNLIKNYCSNRGYNRKIECKVLNRRTSSKRNFLQRTLEMFVESAVLVKNCSIGLDKLAGSRLKKDKNTDYVFFGELIRNGNQHAVDALGYATMVIDNNWAAKTVETNNLAAGNVHTSAKYSTKTMFKY